MKRRRLLRAIVLAALATACGMAAGQSLDQILKAVELGDSRTVASLLGQGLDPNTADAMGNTILMTASRLGHRELVALLVDRKADLTRRSPHGDTALMFASLKGHLEIVKLLVDKGAPVAHDGWAPVHYAAFEGHADVLKFLIDKGADKNALALNGYTALMLAARGGHLVAARMLLYEDVTVGTKGPGGVTALAIAKDRKDVELEALLRRAGAVD